MNRHPTISHLGRLCLLAFAITAQAVPLNFHLAEDSAGPNCVSFTGMGHLEWSRRGGDWVDAAGQLHGDMAFAIQSVAAVPAESITRWNVAALVQGWLDGQFRNEGLWLRAEPGKVNALTSFRSKEFENPVARPVLQLKWSDGSQVWITPEADTYLDCSTYNSLGARKDLKVGPANSALLRFKLPEHKGTLAEASLALVVDHVYGNGANIGVYRAAPPYARPQERVATGLAEGFKLDKGIDKHPSVIFATDFESPFWITQWGEYSPRSNAETISADAEGLFEALEGKALRVRFVKGSNLGLDLRYVFARGGKPEPEEVYFRYYVRFGASWDPYLDGGKLPGIAGTYGRAGWGMRKTDGYDGWSIRGGFAARPPGAKSVAGMTAVGSYVYHADISDSSGEYWGWNEGPSGLLENNRWYAVEQYVKLNTPGEKNGIFRAWIDGYQVAERTAVRFRHTPDLKIETIWLNVYHGGVAPAPQDMVMYIDNVVIARSYIGPAKR